MISTDTDMLTIRKEKVVLCHLKVAGVKKKKSQQVMNNVPPYRFLRCPSSTSSLKSQSCRLTGVTPTQCYLGLPGPYTHLSAFTRSDNKLKKDHSYPEGLYTL